MAEVSEWPEDNVILFDGVCVLCSEWTRFVAKRDKAGRFRFTAIQSPYGRAMAEALGIDPDDPDTNAVTVDGRVLRRSDAALAVLGTLPGWSWVSILRVVPRQLRDAVYAFIARNRYRIFGRRETCELAPPGLMRRVIVDVADDGMRKAPRS
jgi:predicted DCC family thiol-disulfide oxidoreductase YuxK